VVEDNEQMASRFPVIVRALSALALVLTVVSACGDDDNNQAAPTTSSSSAPTSTSVASAGQHVAVYLLRADALAAVDRDLRDIEERDGVDAIEGAVAALMVGPTATELDAGFGTQVPTGTEVRGVTVTDGVATVDLSSQFESAGEPASMVDRVAQITFTATQFPGVNSVKFRLEGRDVKTIGGEAVRVDPPVTRGSFEDQQPAILVDWPAFGTQVGRTFTTRGTSNTFEATHILQVLAPDGSKLVDTFVTATSGSGTRGTWQKDVALPSGTAGAVTLRVFEESAADGSPLHLVDIALDIRP
jgi:hypothetical protein